MKRNKKNNFWSKKLFGKKGPWGKGPKNLIIALLVFVGCLAVLHKLTDYSRQVHTISYSAFLNKVEQNQVNWVRVSGQEVQGAFKDGTHFETIVADVSKNWDVLREHNVDFAVAVASQSFNLWQILPLLILLIFMLVGVWYFMRQSRGSGGSGSNIFSMGKSRAKMFMPSMIKENFDSVAGVAEAKEELEDVIDFLKNPKKYKRLGAKIPRGVLLVGGTREW